MTERVFVDTNVLVYARDSRYPQKQKTAADRLKTLWHSRSGRTSVQVLSEYYVTLTRKLKPGIPPEDAWDDVQSFMSWEPQSIDGEVIIRARELERRYKASWWDATVIAAAQIQSCTVLLSEDLQHGMAFGSLLVLNPFVQSVGERDEAYATLAAAPRPLHRPRGRPSRKV